MTLCFISVWHACDFIMLHVQMEFDEKTIFSFLLYLSLMIDKLKKHKCINNVLYGHRKRGFAIGHFDTGQLLRHMRITLNKKKSG